MNVVLGIDSSTQSTKVEAREIETGKVVGTGSAPHPATTPPLSEQDPASWWSALVAGCDAIDPQVRSRVVAVSVGGQQHGLVLLDQAGAAVRPAKLWNDTTSADQADSLVASLGAQAWVDATGSVPVPAFTVTKLAWVVANQPELLDRVAYVMLPHDYLTWRLSGSHVTDRGDASGTGWFAPSSGDYLPALLDQVGVAGREWVAKLPTVLGPTDVAGELQSEAAAALGLPAGIAIGPGSGDNMAGALGLGLGAGDAVLSIGTSGVVSARSTTPTADPSGLVAGFADATGGFLPLVCTLNATKVTDTVARWFGTDAPGLAAIAMQAGEAVDPTVLAWFDGERTPNRPDAAGQITGLRNDTTREQLARAAHDGVLCGLLNGLDSLRSLGVQLDGTLHLIGGGSRSAAYRQRCADLWQKSIVVPDSDETVATGAAAQAAVVAEGLDTAGFDHIAQRWNLGAGITIEPSASAETVLAIRTRYNNLANRS